MPPYYFTTARVRVRSVREPPPSPAYIQKGRGNKSKKKTKKKKNPFIPDGRARSEVIFLSNSSSPLEDNQKCLISFGAPCTAHAALPPHLIPLAPTHLLTSSTALELHAPEGSTVVTKKNTEYTIAIYWMIHCSREANLSKACNSVSFFFLFNNSYK